MDIVISGSQEYLTYSSVLLKSIAINHPDVAINFHVFHFLSPDQVRLPRLSLETLEKQFTSITLRFYQLDLLSIPDELQKFDGWNPSLWARWQALDTLRNSTDRFLVLGIDTLVKRSITDFYFQDLDGYVFCACPDSWVSTADLSNWPPYEQLKSFNVSPNNYINADVVLVNLSAKQAPTFLEFMQAYIAINTRCLDQDVINYCYSRFLKLAPLKFNYFPNISSDAAKDRELYKDSCIAQFAGAPKPWNVLGLKSFFYVGHREWWRFAHDFGIRRRSLIWNRLKLKAAKLFKNFFD